MTWALKGCNSSPRQSIPAPSGCMQDIQVAKTHYTLTLEALHGGCRNVKVLRAGYLFSLGDVCTTPVTATGFNLCPSHLLEKDSFTQSVQVALRHLAGAVKAEGMHAGG